MLNSSLSLEELSQLGNAFYMENKALLEKKFMGQFVVIDVEEKKYEVDPDRLVAIEKAKKSFGDKLFYIVQIGSVRKPNANFSAKKYAWDF
jgi:hypothetical protein